MSELDDEYLRSQQLVVYPESAPGEYHPVRTRSGVPIGLFYSGSRGRAIASTYNDALCPSKHEAALRLDGLRYRALKRLLMFKLGGYETSDEHDPEKVTASSWGLRTDSVFAVVGGDPPVSLDAAVDQYMLAVPDRSKELES